jgi:hypothetical protein
MRVTVAVAIIVIASIVMARGQSLQDQAICTDHAQKVFEDHNKIQSLVVSAATTTRN